MTIVIGNYNVFTSENGCYKFLSNPQYTALVTYGCDSIKSLLAGCIAGCVAAIVLASLLIFILTRLKRHRTLANKHRMMEEGKLGPDGKPLPEGSVPMQTMEAAGQPIAGQPIAGQPIVGQPVVGQSVVGQPVAIAGQPMGQPVALVEAPQLAPPTPLSPMTTTTYSPPQTVVVQNVPQAITQTYAPPPPVNTIVQTVPQTVVYSAPQ